jgi:hypothetical protein
VELGAGQPGDGREIGEAPPAPARRVRGAHGAVAADVELRNRALVQATVGRAVLTGG